MTLRISIGIFLFALALRSGLLLFNLSFFDFDPYWSWQARASLILVLSDFGVTPLSEGFEALYKMNVDEALQGWPAMDRGLVYVHLLLQSIFGATSYELLQVLHIFIDALLVFPIISISYILSSNMKIAYSIGILYSLFLPQAWLAVQPDYNVWITTGYVLTAWLYLNITILKQDKFHWRSLLGLSIVLFAVMMAINQLRSTIILLPVGMAIWWWVTSLFSTRLLVFSRQFYLPALTLLSVGILVVGFSSTINKSARNDASPVRSTFGHAFWTGIGQFENPHNLRDDDGSVAAFYKKETGLDDVDGSTGGVKYNAWLTHRAFQFISEYPRLYALMVVRRALRILFPNMPFTVVGDKPAYDSTLIEVTRTENRIKLQLEHGKLSMTTISALVLEDPFYIIGLFARLALMILLPLGCILFFIFSERKAMGLLAIVPLVYHVITLSPIYATPIILIPAYAAVLPIVGIGWWLAAKKTSIVLRSIHF